MADDRVLLTYEAAIKRLPDARQIHTFRPSAGGVLLGANWERADLLTAMRAAKVIKEAGPEATARHHGLVIPDDRGPLFIETREEEA